MKYLKYKIGITLASCALLLVSSCKKEKFAEYNTDPDAVIDIAPAPLFTKAISNWHDDSFEAFYEHYRGMSRWTRQIVGLTGNTITVTDGIGNVNERYGRFYSSSGNLLVDVQKTIEKLPADQIPRYAYMNSIAEIMKVYEAWFVTDGNGSIPYTEAFQARYGGTFAPVYNTQEELYDIFDKSLKAAVATLKTTQATEQVSYGTNDLYFQGNVTNWIKVATSLRLKIASRLSKRNPAKLKEIALEVLSTPADLISSVDEDWSLKAGSTFIGLGNWDIQASGAYAPHYTVDFMYRNADPRLKLFYLPNSWTLDRFNQAKAQNKIAANAVYDTRRYYGQFTSPDANSDPNKAIFFNPVTIKDGTNNVNLDTVSQVQNRMWSPQLNDGKGSATILILTYADICFIRAELAATGVTAESASEWYYKGIDASITTYDRMAKAAALADYTALDNNAVIAYKAKPEIVYNPAKGLEQICAQQYLNFYKNFNESWALLKRTGLPNNNTALKVEDFVVSGQVQAMPRRFVINFPLAGDLNFANKEQAIKDMAKDPGFGQPTDVKGRVWWDMP